MLIEIKNVDSALFSFPKLDSDDLCQCLWINYRRPSINASQSNILRFIISIFEGKGICLFAKRISQRIAISIIFPGKDTCVYISRHWWLYGLGMRWGKKKRRRMFFSGWWRHEIYCWCSLAFGHNMTSCSSTTCINNTQAAPHRLHVLA